PGGRRSGRNDGCGGLEEIEGDSIDMETPFKKEPGTGLGCNKSKGARNQELIPSRMRVGDDSQSGKQGLLGSTLRCRILPCTSTKVQPPSNSLLGEGPRF